MARQTVYKHCTKKLAVAMVGDKIDLNHPAVYEFLHTRNYVEPDGAAIAEHVRKGGAVWDGPNTPAKSPAPQQPRTAPAPAQQEPPVVRMGDLEQLAISLGLARVGDDQEMQEAQKWLAMSVREVVARYGTFSRFKELANAAKSLVQMRGYEDDQARKRGEHIHRDHAERLIAHIDALHKALLSDTVTNVITTLQAQVKAGADKKELEKTLHTAISRTIKLTKEQSSRSLRDATKR